MRGRSHLFIGTLSAVEASIFSGFTITPIGIIVAMIFSIIPDIDQASSATLNKFISKNFTKNIHRIVINILLIFFVYSFIKTNNNIYLITLIALIIINFVEKKITENFTRTIVIFCTFSFITLFIIIFNGNYGLVVLTSSFALMSVTKHRSLSHSLLILALMLTTLFYIENTSIFNNITLMAIVAYSSHLLCDIVTKRGIPLFYPISSKNYSIANLKVNSLICNLVELIVIALLFIIAAISVLYFDVKIGLY